MGHRGRGRADREGCRRPGVTQSTARSELRADCARCAGLCCVVPAFTVSADFAIDKPSGVACPNLATDDFGCSIHAELRERGFPGCTVYDCFGAGQRVVAGPLRWPRLAHRPGGPRGAVRDVRGRRAAARAALVPRGRSSRRPPRDRARRARGAADAVERAAAEPHDGDVVPLQLRADALLGEASALYDGRRAATSVATTWPGATCVTSRPGGRRPARRRCCIGADLRGVDLGEADLLGADLRGADVRGADLTPVAVPHPAAGARRGGPTRPPCCRVGPLASVDGMADSLDGTVALVTGASSGIGQATAATLAARGRCGGARRPAYRPARGARRLDRDGGGHRADHHCRRHRPGAGRAGRGADRRASSAASTPSSTTPA